MKVLFVILIFYLFDVIEMSRYSYYKIYIYNSNFVTLVTVEDSSRVQKQRLEDRKATKLPGLYQLVIMMKRLN